MRQSWHPGTPNGWSDLVDLGSPPVPTPQLRRIIQFGFYTLVIRATIAGQGLALIPCELVETELATGLLQQVGSFGFASPNAYWFVHPSARSTRPALDRFGAWLREKAGTEPDDGVRAL